MMVHKWSRSKGMVGNMLPICRVRHTIRLNPKFCVYSWDLVSCKRCLAKRKKK
jgi:hypothetical protein